MALPTTRNELDVATLTVWKFPEPTAAGEAIKTLEGLQSQELITIVDAAVVEWQEGKKKPKTRQMNNIAGGGALGGAFWGLLFGLIFFVPLVGMALGAVLGGVTGALTDVGIDDDFIDDVKKAVTPGTSALFLMSSNAVPDRIHDVFAGSGAQLISTNLSKEQEDALRHAFSDD